jgi:hypothetical protein
MIGLRKRIADWLAEPILDRVEGRIRGWIAQDIPAPDTELGDRIAKLEKKVDMIMGAVQAGTAATMSARRAADDAGRQASKAMAVATTAKSTAEAATDALSELETGASA